MAMSRNFYTSRCGYVPTSRTCSQESEVQDHTGTVTHARIVSIMARSINVNNTFIRTVGDLSRNT